jgi:hypothetical protein
MLLEQACHRANRPLSTADPAIGFIQGWQVWLVAAACEVH